MAIEWLKNWIASFRRIDGVELPSEGRSSVESTLGQGIGSALSRFGSISPVINFEMLRCLKMLYIFNPDLSQFVSNIVNLGNTGHEVVIGASSSGRTEAALKRLNEASYRIYRNGAGVDGLINAYLSQIAWSGALSSEDVVNFPGRRVEQVALVPVEEIRFRYLNGEYVPHQQPRTLVTRPTELGLIPLNPETYKYFALSTVENSPYAKPPASAAIAAITGPQTDMIDNVKWIAKKLGILGLVSVLVSPPGRQPGKETDAEAQSRAQRYLANVRDTLEGNFNKGLLIHTRDQKITHSNVASDARGAYDIFRLNEEQVMSGLAMQPAFFGRTDSTTETYADVVYNLLLAQVHNIQRLVKRRQEATYRLDLLLGGFQVDGVSVVFNRAHARDPLAEAQADAARLQTVIEKVKAGFISPDMGAQELGYDSAFDPELLTALPNVAAGLRASFGAGCQKPAITLRFDRSSQTYKVVSSAIYIGAGAPAEADNVVPLKKKTA